MGWPAVQSYQNGEDVVAEVLNKPIGQLAERTDYLKRLIEMNDRTKVVVSAEVMEPPGTSDVGYPAVGQPVYRVPGSAAYATAAAVVAENEWFYADPKAMAVGIVGARDTTSETEASIVLYGFVDFGADGISASSVIIDAEPVSGRYYLSPEYGKLTAAPNGPVIYVCDCRVVYSAKKGEYRILSMLVNPQYRDTGESHIHRSFVVSGLPQGGYARKVSGYYRVQYNIWPKGESPVAGYGYPLVSMQVCGAWTSSRDITYTFRVVKADPASSGSAWEDYRLVWTATGDIPGGDVSGETPVFTVDDTTYESQRLPIGSHGMQVRMCMRNYVEPYTTPEDLADKVWTLTMPDAGRGWLSVGVKGTFRLNLGMYPEMARFVPPVPANSSTLVVDEVEPRGAIFGDRKQWEIVAADSDGGPWLMWYGGAVIGDSKTTPFKYVSDYTKAEARDITLYLNRMRVGPTGFVTSLQPAPGSIIRVTSAQTGADAVQGALQVGLDVDFKTAEGGVPGSEVVKRIEGDTFKTGPVVERIVAGPGVSLLPAGGQGTVTLSVSNATYAGDFETIALKNAKQDLAGQIFPYTKLLGWADSSTGNIDSGFTVKFRVPDHIPYRPSGYKVIVSMSVFGEGDSDASTTAAFRMRNYVLGDYACSLNADAVSPAPVGQISSPAEGIEAVVPVTFSEGYRAFDPVLVHGFPVATVPDIPQQRQHQDSLLLRRDNAGAVEDVVVYPGYFVGLSIDRCDVLGSSTWYTAPLGFLSLRWNLVEVPDAVSA